MQAGRGGGGGEGGAGTGLDRRREAGMEAAAAPAGEEGAEP